jgi:16S rRNA (guanine527-N7)-methyltransferase
MNSPTTAFQAAVASNAADYGVTVDGSPLLGLSEYYRLLSAWNARVHLVAPCSPEEFATRHVLESLLLLKHLPPRASVAEVGAGGGLPIIPCLIVRPDIRGILIEASRKKAVFLREALQTTGIGNRAHVIADRFENVQPLDLTFVTCRALERFEDMLPKIFQWAPANTTFLLFGGQRIERRIESLGYTSETELIPRSKARFLFIVKRN